MLPRIRPPLNTAPPPVADDPIERLRQATIFHRRRLGLNDDGTEKGGPQPIGEIVAEVMRGRGIGLYEAPAGFQHAPLTYSPAGQPLCQCGHALQLASGLRFYVEGRNAVRCDGCSTRGVLVVQDLLNNRSMRLHVEAAR